MKLQKEKSRNYKGKTYYKYKVNIHYKTISEAGFKVGDELKAEAEKDKIVLKKAVKIVE